MTMRAMMFLVFALALALPAAADAQTPAPRPKPPVENHSQLLTDADFDLFRRALRAAEDDDWDAVRADMARIQDDAARNVLLWRIATSDPRTRFAELDHALETLEGWPRDTAIQREAEWKLSEANIAPAEVVAWFEGRTPLTGEGRVSLGEALIELGEVEAGREEIRTAWRTQSMRLRFQNDVLSRHGGFLTEDDHAARVDTLLWAGQRSSASRLLSRLNTGDRRLAEARIRLAARSSGVDAAVAAVPDTLSNDPGLVFERARWRRRAGLDDAALPLLLQLPDAYENNGALEAMWTERKLMILDLVRDEDYATAYDLAASNGMTEGVDFADAEFLAGWLALVHLGEPEAALEHFQRLEQGVTTPVSTSRALYWQGRAAEAAGQIDLARDRLLAAAQYPTAYYGQLARYALGPDAAQLELPPDPDITPAVRARFEARPMVRALRLLAEMDEAYYFRVFSYHMDDLFTDPREQALLVDLSIEFLRVRQAVRAAKAARMQGAPLAERAYPVIELPQNAPIFPEAALTHSVIRQETEFDPRAVSGAGARGMMQMMPATARQTARQIGKPYNFQWLTDDPDYNLVLGMAHLEEVVEDYDGSLVMALAAYNAGGHRVRRWVQSYGDPRTGEIDPIDWVESIPFSETRNYVQRVLENLQVYRARMSDGDAPLFIERDMVGQAGLVESVARLPEDAFALIPPPAPLQLGFDAAPDPAPAAAEAETPDALDTAPVVEAAVAPDPAPAVEASLVESAPLAASSPEPAAETPAQTPAAQARPDEAQPVGDGAARSRMLFGAEAQAVAERALRPREPEPAGAPAEPGRALTMEEADALLSASPSETPPADTPQAAVPEGGRTLTMEEADALLRAAPGGQGDALIDEDDADDAEAPIDGDAESER